VTRRDDAAPTLPATVVAAHLKACATELAVGRGAPNVPDLADLTAVVEDLVAGQQQIALALAHLADQITARRQRTGPDMSALAEVLGAAATATGHAADALAESRPVLDIVLASAGPETQL
jgi:ABC-type transporter Mla subunit MlaD